MVAKGEGEGEGEGRGRGRGANAIPSRQRRRRPASQGRQPLVTPCSMIEVAKRRHPVRRRFNADVVGGVMTMRKSGNHVPCTVRRPLRDCGKMLLVPGSRFQVPGAEAPGWRGIAALGGLGKCCTTGVASSGSANGERLCHPRLSRAFSPPSHVWSGTQGAALGCHETAPLALSQGRSKERFICVCPLCLTPSFMSYFRHRNTLLSFSIHLLDLDLHRAGRLDMTGGGIDSRRVFHLSRRKAAFASAWATSSYGDDADKKQRLGG